MWFTPRRAAPSGFWSFYDGVPLIPALVGLFAVSEAFIIIEKKVIVTHEGDVKHSNWHDTFEGVRMALSPVVAHRLDLAHWACDRRDSGSRSVHRQLRRLSAIAHGLERRPSFTAPAIPRG